MSQAVRTAPAARLFVKELMDALATRLGGGADTTLATAITFITSVSRLDPQRLEVRQADGTRMLITITHGK